MSAHFRSVDDLPPSLRDQGRRKVLGLPTAQEERDTHTTEKQEQAAIVKLFRERGCKVYNLSQARASRQSAGLPDLWVVHMASGKAWWFECKRAVGGVYSEFQKDFAKECRRCGVNYWSGDRHDARLLLEQLGLK